MALAHLAAIAAALMAAGRDADEPVALLSMPPPRASAACARWQGGGRRRLLEAGAPTLVVIGPVVGLSEVLAAHQQSAPARLVDQSLLQAAGAPGG